MKKFKVTYDIEQTIKQGRFEVTFECTSADAARALIESPIGPPAGATRLCRPVSDILGVGWEDERLGSTERNVRS